MSNSLRPCRLWSARLLCQGALQARTLECIGQYWLPYPSRALFPAALATNSPEYPVLPEPLRPKQLQPLHTWPSQGQTQALQGSRRSKPQWTIHMQRWKFISVTQSCPVLFDPMDCSTPGLLSITKSQNLLKLLSIESVMPSNHLILCCPLLLLPSIFPSIRVFSNESVFHVR